MRAFWKQWGITRRGNQRSPGYGKCGGSERRGKGREEGVRRRV